MMPTPQPSDIDWHDSECHRFDYVPVDDDHATCLSCGTFGPKAVSLPPLPSESSFRLLWLENGRYEDIVRCRVQVIDLKHQPAFNAISYTWADDNGDDRRLAKILLDGKPFRVTRNCEAALRRVRQHDHHTFTWIDAICIDQSNDMERGHQVKLMPQIYHQARKVFMYIGEHDDDSRKWFNHFETCPIDNFEGSQAELYFDSQQMWNAIKERNYFTRLWILQEIALANQAIVLCGESSLQWRHIIKYGLGKDGVRSNLKDSVLDFNHSIVTVPDMELFVLDGGRHALCKDPRDKVYGLLGLLPGRRIGPIVADYSVSVQQLYTSLAIELARLHGWSAVLMRAGSKLQSSRSLPSWVPDWTFMPSDRSIPKTISQSVSVGSDSVIVSNTRMRLNLFQSPTADDRWFPSDSRDESAEMYLLYETGGLLDLLQPHLRRASRRMGSRWHNEFSEPFPFWVRLDDRFQKAGPCLVLRQSQTLQEPRQEPGYQTRVLHELIPTCGLVFPVKQNIFPPILLSDLRRIIFSELDPLLVRKWLGPRRDASRSAIMDVLRQAYSETHKDSSREWTLQAESLWAEGYKEENVILESWRREKKERLERHLADQWLWSSSHRADLEKEYLEAKGEWEDVDFEMNDLFWRLCVRRCAVRAQLVDIV